MPSSPVYPEPSDTGEFVAASDSALEFWSDGKIVSREYHKAWVGGHHEGPSFEGGPASN